MSLAEKNGIAASLASQPADGTAMMSLKSRIESLLGFKISHDDPIIVILSGIELLYHHTLEQSAISIQDKVNGALAEYKLGLDEAANHKKREVRQELITLASIIQDKLQVEADHINKPLLARIEELKGIAATIGSNYAQFRWHDRIIGFLCGSLLFLASFAAGVVFEIARGK